MRKSLLAAAFLGLLTAGPAMADAPPPDVLVSIKPLHGLVAAVMKGVAEPGLIVSGDASPHDYAMKPSDARALERARLLVWVGKDFEGWLKKPAAKARHRLTMQEIPGMTRLATREGGVWDSHGNDHGHKDHGKDDHDETDGHLWLDPDNAARLVDAVAGRLAEMDPARADRYKANAAETRKRLADLDSTLAARLKPVAGKPYVVFHDAHQYFEARYGLTPAGAVTIDPERPPSAKRMAALRDRLKATKAACVFREPRFAGPTVQALADAAGARIALLDPEGALAEAGPDAYFTIMTAIADSLADCLSGR
ncbi:zinc ABC transporter substrate-binding protein [Magnetospirillum sp. SS-4]|uniref:zinc ABC transporter substrate-binding protein n=1 Tax=Magnetospirillum sp. SS-4 TaxID=2681465 RepID=UPI00137F90AD|nr:zinc ABC transporter substrate-binding protein [Magnetospirillum sp. SS-4]CAA7626168.1 High-affinity zinc uptake system protein ZnuA [Magnetospirillum sp. SS-4]